MVGCPENNLELLLSYVVAPEIHSPQEPEKTPLDLLATIVDIERAPPEFRESALKQAQQDMYEDDIRLHGKALRENAFIRQWGADPDHVRAALKAHVETHAPCFERYVRIITEGVRSTDRIRELTLQKMREQNPHLVGPQSFGPPTPYGAQFRNIDAVYLGLFSG